MPFALTQSSAVVCIHQGKVALVPSQSKLTVGGAAVLVESDVAGKAIGSCTLAPSTNTVTCTAAVNELAGGTSGRLTVGGKAVLIQNVNGLTNGSQNGAPPTWSVQNAAQTKLKTS